MNTDANEIQGWSQKPAGDVEKAYGVDDWCQQSLDFIQVWSPQSPVDQAVDGGSIDTSQPSPSPSATTTSDDAIEDPYKTAVQFRLERRSIWDAALLETIRKYPQALHGYEYMAPELIEHIVFIATGVRL
jgi:hypothetical protein